MDATSTTGIIRRHLNNKKIKHMIRIDLPRLTLKHKKKRLEYSRQYQSMITKEWWKVVFLDEKKFNLDGPDGFQKYCSTNIYLEEDHSTRRSGGTLMIGVGFLSAIYH